MRSADHLGLIFREVFKYGCDPLDRQTLLSIRCSLSEVRGMYIYLTLY